MERTIAPSPPERAGGAVKPPGFYDRPVTLRLPTGVRYTLDGSTPKADSPVAEEELTFRETTAVRWQKFSAAAAPEGFPQGGTYLINEPDTRLLTLSVAIDPWRLFDPVKGWFKAGPGADPGHWKQPGANWWTRRSHPAHVDLVETDGRCVFSATVDYRMFGGMSRIHPQKSFSISARKAYGKHKIKHRLFGPDGPKSFQFLVARNAGSDWNRSYLRDALLTGLLEDESWDLDHQAARPVQVYINGKYWGIFHLREKINPQFISDRHDIDEKDNIDLLEHQETVKHGQSANYRKLIRFVETHDLSDPANYRRVQEWMDVDNYQRLQIAQTYFDNRDAGGNIRYWRDRTDPSSRWRWILYDVDQGFGLHDPEAYARNTIAFYTEANGPSWPNPPWSTLLQRRLLANPGYRRDFVNRSLDYLHTDFAPKKVLAAIDDRVGALAYDMPRQLKRWRGKEKFWRIHLDRLRSFARARPAHLREHLRQLAGGGADREVKITAAPGGYVVLNRNIWIDEASLSGRYFSNLPLHLRAVAHLGFRFKGWEGRSGGPAFSMSLQPPGPHERTALFEPFTHPLAGQLHISELSPSAADGDWLELFNESEQTIDLQGWVLTDRTHEVRLPRLEIRPGERLLLAEHPEKFARLATCHQLPFGLGKAEETLGLYAPDGAYVDRVHYSFEAPSGHFVLLEGENGWLPQGGLGSPGKENPVLHVGTITGTSYWRRLGAGAGILFLIILIRVYTSSSADEDS